MQILLKHLIIKNKKTLKFLMTALKPVFMYYQNICLKTIYLKREIYKYGIKIKMFKIIKIIDSVVSFVLAAIAAPVFILLGYIAAKIKRFAEFNIFLAYMPFYFGEQLRSLYYRALLKKVGKKVK